TNTDGVRELRHVFHDIGDAFEQVDGGGALFDHTDRNLSRPYAAAIGPNDELAREDVLVDEARADDVEQREAPEGLEPMGVRPTEAEEQLEHRRVRNAGDVTDGGSIVLCSLHELRANDEIGLTALQDVDRTAMKVDVTQVDLVADDELAA